MNTRGCGGATLREVDGHDTQRLPDLNSRQSNTARPIHRRKHIPDEQAGGFIDSLDRSRHSSEPSVRNNENLTRRHCQISRRFRERVQAPRTARNCYYISYCTCDLISIRFDNRNSRPLMDQSCGSIAANLPISQEGNVGTPSASAMRGLLTQAGLRPTRPRLALASLLFTGEPRHVTASSLAREASEAGACLSLATIYNSLNQFTEAGLLHRVSVSGDLAYFDTKAGDHHHFFIEDENRILDIPPGSLVFGRLPEPPDGYVITKVDVVIRLTRIDQSRSDPIRKRELAKLRTASDRTRDVDISA